MKSLIITGIFPPEIGGPATFTVAFSKWLESHGHEATILTLNPQKRSKIKNGVTYIPRLKPKIFRFLFVSCRILREFKSVDSILATGLHEETGFALHLIRKKSIARIVGDPVWERAANGGRTTLRVSEFQNSRLDFIAKIQRKLLVWSLNQFTQITCPSLELCQIVKNWGVQRPVKYIPNGVEIMAMGAVPKRYDIITISRLVNWKNLDQVLEATRGLKLKILIVGDGPEMKHLVEKSLALGVDAEFAGEVPQERTRILLQQSKMFIQVSSYEGLSFSLLQAMETGIPCIVSNIPGNLQVIQNNSEALIVELGDHKQLRQSIESILNSPTLANNLSLNSRMRICQDFNQDKQFQYLIEALELGN